MNKKRTRGFLDPISLGFILALAGTATVLTLHPKSDQNDPVQVSTNSHQTVQMQAVKQN